MGNAIDPHACLLNSRDRRNTWVAGWPISVHACARQGFSSRAFAWTPVGLLNDPVTPSSRYGEAGICRKRTRVGRNACNGRRNRPRCGSVACRWPVNVLAYRKRSLSGVATSGKPAMPPEPCNVAQTSSHDGSSSRRQQHDQSDDPIAYVLLSAVDRNCPGKQASRKAAAQLSIRFTSFTQGMGCPLEVQRPSEAF